MRRRDLGAAYIRRTPYVTFAVTTNSNIINKLLRKRMERKKSWTFGEGLESLFCGDFAQVRLPRSHAPDDCITRVLECSPTSQETTR